MIRIGISGWTYAPWRGVFFPPGLPQRRELEYASRNFRAIEINGTFYGLQRPEAFQSWVRDTPEEFIFTVKGSRFITHMKRLKDIDTALPNFLASGVLALGRKLGPFLWQFPPQFQYRRDRFESFFRALPRTMSEAAELAKQHDERMNGRAFLEPDIELPLQHCVEIRHPSFLVPEFFELLREHHIGFVLADSAGIWPYAEEITSELLYIRLHGAEQLYASGYTHSALDWWANRIRTWSRGREPADAKRITPKSTRQASVKDVFVFFDNDAKVHAPFDAHALAARLGVDLPVPTFETSTRRKSKQVTEEPRAAAPRFGPARKKTQKSPSSKPDGTAKKSGSRKEVNRRGRTLDGQSVSNATAGRL